LAGIGLGGCRSGVANCSSQVGGLDQLDVGAVRQGKLNGSVFAVETDANTNQVSFFDLLHDTPAFVAYPAHDAGIHEIGRDDLRKLFTKTASRLLEVLCQSKIGWSIGCFGLDDDSAEA
jgi:hypothetical protein